MMESPQDKALSHPKPDDQGGSDIIATYFNDIGKFPLLTRAKEVELAAKIKAGDHEARELMINCNLRLVVKIARDYVDFGLPLADLISEGNLGLITAVERFDPARGGKLSTYAVWWIKQRIKRALANQGKTIRLPVHVAEKLSQIRKTTTILQDELDREPTDEEIAKELKTSASKISHLKSISTHPSSLDAPVGEEESTTLGELIGDENAPTPADSLEEQNLQEGVHDTINELTSREAEVIRLRFGLAGSSPQTLKKIGEKLGVTRERIRQLQNIALVRIRKKLSELERESTREELEEQRRESQKMEVLQEFLENKIKEGDEMAAS